QSLQYPSQPVVRETPDVEYKAFSLESGEESGDKHGRKYFFNSEVHITRFSSPALADDRGLPGSTGIYIGNCTGQPGYASYDRYETGPGGGRSRYLSGGRTPTF